jgi:Nucleoside-diphosphate-sugar pyrophosphorylase involved in lipopolysaccharide biosynthesis/translation initiation factor 2B, gamma/epsilon subunits (eIF-2Bgamma/eIF-2Bepsilon)
MDSLILCGGFATRLEPITLFVPKPLLPIRGKPIVDYILENVSRNGVERIVISTNKKFADQFMYWKTHREAVNGLHNRIEMVIEPTMHNGEKYGAIRGINHAIEKAHFGNDLLIIAGDNFYDFDLSALIRHFNATRRPTIAVYDVGSLEQAKRFGVVTVRGSRVVGFQEKPESPQSTLISTGIYIFPRETLKRFKEYLYDKNNPMPPDTSFSG